MRKIMVSMLRVMGMKTVIVANSESQCMQKISITSADYQNFILIKVHNITEIPAEDLDNIAHLSLSNKTNQMNDMTITLAFLIMVKLQDELYFHSSKEFGTTF